MERRKYKSRTVSIRRDEMDSLFVLEVNTRTKDKLTIKIMRAQENSDEIKDTPRCSLPFRYAFCKRITRTREGIDVTNFSTVSIPI